MITTTVTTTQLSNGIAVKCKEIHTAPLISHWVWYRVGSRDEMPGKIGISHWVEHMQFKGTPKFPAGVLDKVISRTGGVWNAFTYLDWTAFYETLPADKIDLAMNLEAERMVNSIFDSQEVKSERTVIISEREGHENNPLFRLDEAIRAAAFNEHPYRHEVIGEIEDLRRIKRDDLYEHYRTYYVPNNALITIAGDFNTSDMLNLLEEHYGKITAAKEQPPHSTKPEPPLSAERQLEVKGPGETTYLQVAYRAPAASESDFFAFSIMDSLLTGPASLNMFGGGGLSNKTSRLYRALVERELAVSVGGGLRATIDPFLYDILTIIRPEQAPLEVLESLDDEIQRIQEQLVSIEEIERAVKQARAMFAYGSENITNQAFWLGYAEMFASYNWFLNYVQELEKITPEDIQRTAQVYLHPSRRVVGTYMPNGIGGEEE